MGHGERDEDGEMCAERCWLQDPEAKTTCARTQLHGGRDKQKLSSFLFSSKVLLTHAHIGMLVLDR